MKNKILLLILFITIPEVVLSQHSSISNNIDEVGPSYTLENNNNLSTDSFIFNQPEEIVFLGSQPGEQWQDPVMLGIKPLECSIHCEIPNKKVIPLSEVFTINTAETDPPIQQALLSFSVSNRSEFNLNLEQNADITITQRTVMISGHGVTNTLEFELQKETTRLSFLFHFQNEKLFFNYMESIGVQPHYLSPIIELGRVVQPKAGFLPDIVIYNGNPDGQLVMENVLMATQQSGHIRNKRGVAGILGCLTSGPLALYNVITQGHCTQVESAWKKIKAFFSGEDQSKMIILAGEAKPVKPINPSSLVSVAEKNALILTHIDSHLHNQSLTLPAAARYCQTPIKNVISGRYPRQIRYSCATWISAVLEDFTLLFGANLRTWSTEYLIQTLNGILDRQSLDNDNDAMDAFIQNPSSGHRLIQTINNVAEQQGRSDVIDSVTSAFSYAAQNYAHYAELNLPAGAYAIPSNDLSCSNNESDASDSDSASDISTPLQAQRFPLGTYELTLSTYVPQEFSPLILRHGEWITSEDRFDIEIIKGTIAETRQQRYDLLESIADWGNIYHERKTCCNKYGIFSSEIETNRYAGQTANQIIRSVLRSYAMSNRIAVVRLNHQVVSVSAANIYFDFIDETNNEIRFASIMATVTDPAYVLTPYKEGTIRRAGSAAVNALIQQMHADGVTSIMTEVISRPSAKVKTRLGFNFLPDILPTAPPRNDL
ncbi:hypothetical protein BD65_2029 [Yersinia ruckeri]|uniref:hypothetical protein n=1 Tax=Yersinia ruckeri TaxID=29486 RepID=UPI0005AD5619|nr:hypothetical protein [Yersinia ruckeri]AJI95783.1 hypothetical protein BD65_2029 [Yersinia ruckeri]